MVAGPLIALLIIAAVSLLIVRVESSALMMTGNGVENFPFFWKLSTCLRAAGCAV
jgi:hypothetical protein